MNVNLKLLFVAFPLALIKYYFEKYLFSDWEFLKFLLLIVGLDTCLGIWSNYKAHTISSRGFSKLFTKCIIYFSLLILTNLLTKYCVDGVQNSLFNWLDNVIYCAIIVREAISVLEHMTAISPGILPSWILKRLKQFDESGNLKDLTNDTKQD